MYVFVIQSLDWYRAWKYTRVTQYTYGVCERDGVNVRQDKTPLATSKRSEMTDYGYAMILMMMIMMMMPTQQ